MDADPVLAALESQRAAERAFVETARASEKAPKGWPAALVMFHIGMWRERMRDSLTAAIDGREYALPGTSDEINDAELPSGIGTPLNDAAARAEHLLTEIVQLFEKAADKPVHWFKATTASEAVLRNSYVHPRSHMCAYLAENGEVGRARELRDQALSELDKLSASAYVIAGLEPLRNDPRLNDEVSR